MAFCFNFSSDDQDQSVKNEKEKNHETENLAAAREIKITSEYDMDDYDLLELKLNNGETLQYIDSHMIEEKLKDSEENSQVDSSVRGALQSGSDLQPNIYEGGLKIWECATDLVEYIASQNLEYQDCKVLELGCGAGLPGLYTYSKGATVHFNDYNWEVLKYITIPNVLFNTDEEGGDETRRCRFFCGDWTSLTQLLSKENLRYNIILTSETIYNATNYCKLLETMKELLKPDGKIYLAAKTYYFGVGGGISSFIDHVNKEGDFAIKSHQIFGEGIKREILEMGLIKKS